MPAGQTPHTIMLFSHNDLVDAVQPGDRYYWMFKVGAVQNDNNNITVYFKVNRNELNNNNIVM